MPTTFDDRIVRIVFEFGGQSVAVDSSLDPTNPPFIAASGVKYADVTQNECTLQVGGLSRDLRNALATNLTMYDPMPETKRKSVEVWAGRVSTGFFLKYKGDIVSAVPSQPPDITMSFRSKTAQFFKYDLLAQSYAVAAPMSQIAADVAKSMGLTLDFQATDKNIANYSFSGPRIDQVNKLSDFGSVDVFIDDTKLVCKNKGQPLARQTYELSEETGMIGQVELTEYGIRIKALLAANAEIGSTLSLRSVQNPSLDGDYTIYKTGFQIATRAEPFYDILEATRYPNKLLGTLPL